jgi:methyl-accepting chemotaxis protein
MLITTFIRNKWTALLKHSKFSIPGRAWGGRLETLGRELDALTKGSESEFLTMGENLQDFSLRARVISQESSSVAQLMAGADINQSIKKLHLIFNRIEHLKNECERGTDVLQDVLHILSGIKDSVAGFMKIVKTLSILGIFTRVESAHLGDAGADFSTLADEVNQLAQDIEIKSVNIVNQSQSLYSLIQESLSKVLALAAQQRGQVQTIIDNTMTSLQSLTDKHSHSSVAAQNISDNFKDISQKISQIITSLQFHDITRQQIEHVEQSLSGVGALLEQEPSKNGQGLTPIKMANHICKIQEAQLVAARDKFTTAVINIVENLTGISQDIIDISQSAQELAGDASQEEHTCLGEIKGHLAASSSALEQYGLASRDLSLLMDAVTPALREMAIFLKDIERIEIAIERIALNSCIKAAQLGPAGVSLGVIAEAIQRLAVETRQHMITVTGNLQSITSAAQELSVNKGNSDDRGDGDVALLLTDIGEILNSLQNLNADVVSLINQVSQKARSLSENIQQAGRAITVHARAEEVISRGLTTLQDLAAQFQAQFPALNQLSDADDLQLETLLAKYTMHDERQVHESVTAPGLPPAAESIPALTYLGDKPNSEQGRQEEEDLGDNVELF